MHNTFNSKFLEAHSKFFETHFKFTTNSEIFTTHFKIFATHFEIFSTHSPQDPKYWQRKRNGYTAPPSFFAAMFCSMCGESLQVSFKQQEDLSDIVKINIGVMVPDSGQLRRVRGKSLTVMSRKMFKYFKMSIKLVQRNFNLMHITKEYMFLTIATILLTVSLVWHGYFSYLFICYSTWVRYLHSLHLYFHEL